MLWVKSSHWVNIVDYITIHFVLHYRNLTRDEKISKVEAIKLTIEHIGRPIILTSAVHLAGFLIFLTTDFLPLYQFGFLAGMSMLAAVIGDLILLPALLVIFDKDFQAKEETQPKNQSVRTEKVLAETK